MLRPLQGDSMGNPPSKLNFREGNDSDHRKTSDLTPGQSREPYETNGNVVGKDLVRNAKILMVVDLADTTDDECDDEKKQNDDNAAKAVEKNHSGRNSKRISDSSITCSELPLSALTVSKHPLSGYLQNQFHTDTPPDTTDKPSRKRNLSTVIYSNSQRENSSIRSPRYKPAIAVFDHVSKISPKLQTPKKCSKETGLEIDVTSDNDSSSAKENHEKTLVQYDKQRNAVVPLKTPVEPTNVTEPDSLDKNITPGKVASDETLRSRKRKVLPLVTSASICKSESLNKSKEELGTNSLPIDLADSSDDEPETKIIFGCQVFDENRNSLETSIKSKQNPVGLSKHLRPFTKRCWNCSEKLRQIPPTSFAEDEEYLCNAMHFHPILKYPLCAFCCQQVEQVETQLDSAYCSGCGTHEDDQEGASIFYCDSDGCQRHFCETCLAKIYGGGEEGERIMRMHMKNTEAWLCPICDIGTQSQLELLRESIQAKAETSTTESPRAIKIVLKDLYNAETEKRLCHKMMENIDERTERKIRKELSQKFSGKELNREVEIEKMLLLDLLRKDEFNISDLVNVLQEELQDDHRISLESVYKSESILKAVHGDGFSGDNDGTDPDYVRSANAELDKRYRAIDAKNVFPDNIYMEERYEDVEDLCNDFEGDEEITDGGWRENKHRLHKEDIRKVLMMEDEELEVLKIPIRKIVEEDDEEECKRDEKYAASRSDFRGTKGMFAHVEHRLRQRRLDLPHNLSGKDTQLSQGSPKQNRNPARSLPVGLNRKINVNLERCASKALSALKHTRTDRNESAMIQTNTANPSMLSKSSEPVDESKDSHSLGFSSFHHYLFESSTVSLCADSLLDGGQMIRSVAVATHLSCKLKSFQLQGIKFLWDNCFSDFERKVEGDESLVGGCILAHHMGCGKSLTTIALLHAVLRHPSMINNDNKRLIQRILLVIPVNTVASWETEFDKWLGDIDRITVYNLVSPNGRAGSVNKWNRNGGVLLVTDGLLVALSGEKAKERAKNGDALLYDCFVKRTQVLVVDEAHSMLKNPNTKTFEALQSVSTRRKIALTGSPFQNDLLEYFRMVNFVRPNVLNMDEALFVSNFKNQIERGMLKDASKRERYESLLKSKELHQAFSAHVHRVNGTELRKGLPKLQEAIIYLQQSRFQKDVSNHFLRRLKKDCSNNNFFRRYYGLRSIFNHPGSVVLWQKKRDGEPNEADDELVKVSDIYEQLGFDKLVRKAGGEDKVLAVENGFKITVLLHILAFAQRLNEKVLVFSHCLKTLSYIEYVLTRENWKDIVPSLQKEFSDMKLGGWKESTDYFRIDGQTHSADRGDRVDLFNADGDSNYSARAFLLSSRAGSLGINLQAATRVVVIDEHFNPTYTSQAVCRAYRLGQTKPVFCYLLLVENTMEEKVFSRGVNKIAIGLQVIDRKTINQNFTAREVQDLSKLDYWVQCEKCLKWRMLREDENVEDLPKDWDCSMNVNDPVNSSCEAEEKNPEWYTEHFYGTNKESIQVTYDGSDDEILKHLKLIKDPSKRGFLVRDVKFKDILLVSTSDDGELELARKAYEQENNFLELQPTLLSVMDEPLRKKKLAAESSNSNLSSESAVEVERDERSTWAKATTGCDKTTTIMHEVEIDKNTCEQGSDSLELQPALLSVNAQQSSKKQLVAQSNLSGLSRESAVEKANNSKCAPTATEFDKTCSTTQQEVESNNCIPLDEPFRFLSSMAAEENPRRKRQIAVKSCLPFPKHSRVEDSNDVASNAFAPEQKVLDVSKTSQSDCSERNDESGTKEVIDLCDDDDAA